MTKPITFLVIILLFFTILLATLTYLFKNNNFYSARTAEQKGDIQTQGQSPQASYSLLNFSPAKLMVTPGVRSSINVTIGSDGEYPTSIQLELSYNPSALADMEIQPGKFLPNPQILLNQINPATGRISYALTLPTGQKPINKSGTVAILSFTPLTNLPTKISFLPKTTVHAFNQPSILKDMWDAEILVSPPPDITSQLPPANNSGDQSSSLPAQVPPSPKMTP
jgi:hypothetical protein